MWHSAKYHLLPIDPRTPPSESIAPLLTSKSPSPSQAGPTPLALRMRLGLRHPGSLTSPHPVVHRLFRFVIRPRRGNDEAEELDLVLAHYAATWGLKLPAGQQLNSPTKWTGWGLKAVHSGHPDSDSD